MIKKFNTRDDRKIHQDKKTGAIRVLEVPKLSILSYYQFVKLMTELEDMKYKLTIVENKKGRKIGTKIDTVVKINKSRFQHIDLNWIRKQPSIYNLQDKYCKSKRGGKTLRSKSVSKSAFKFFDDNSHLFETFACNLVRDERDIDNDNFFTVKIPKHANIETIKKQINLITDFHEFKGNKTLSNTFSVRDKTMQEYERLLYSFILREKHGYIWKDILSALELGYDTTGKTYDDFSVKSAQRLFMKCKIVIYNLMNENIFAKTTL